MAKKVSESKAVAVKEENKFVPQTVNSSSAMAANLKLNNALFDGVEKSVMGEDKDLFSNDILMPKIWLIQQMSEMFAEGKAKLGDYVSSINGEVLADKDTPLYFIVLSMFKRWHTFEMVAGKQEFLSSEIMTTKNANYLYEDTLEGKSIIRKQVISAYIVLVEDIKKGINKPYVIDFASTSKGAGRALVTDIATLESANAPSWVGWFALTNKQEENDKGKFQVKDVKFQGYLDTNNEPLMKFMRDCYDYIKIHKDQIVIDDSDVKGHQTEADLDQKAQNAKAERAASAKI